MINHRQAMTLAATAVDFPLDTSDRGALDAHVRECGACRADLAAFRHDAARLAALPPIPPPAWVRRAIGRPRRPRPIVLLAAAAFLVTASAGITLMVGSTFRDARIPPAPPSVLPVASPVATVLTSGPPEPTKVPEAPIPSGLLLFMQQTPTYQSYQMVRVVNADGSGLRTLGQGVEASWSADGRFVHIVSQDAGCVPSLITEAPDGSGRVVVSGGLRSLDADFAWSPDERQVVFVRFRNGPPQKMCGSQGGTYGPTQLIYDLWVMNADGSGARVLSANFQLNDVPAIVWSPDSSQVAFLAPSKYPTLNGNPAWSVAFVRVGDGTRTDSGTSNVSFGENGLAWSPDGARLAFSYAPDATCACSSVAVVPAVARSTGFISLTGGVAAMQLGVPIWSPDGTTIVVRKEIDAASGPIIGGDLLLLDSVKGGLVRDLGLTDAAGPGTPTWSADGRWLAYVSQDWSGNPTGTNAGPGPIVVVAIDGTGRLVVPGTSSTATDHVDTVTSVAWQPIP